MRNINQISSASSPAHHPSKRDPKQAFADELAKVDDKAPAGPLAPRRADVGQTVTSPALAPTTGAFLKMAEPPKILAAPVVSAGTPKPAAIPLLPALANQPTQGTKSGVVEEPMVSSVLEAGNPGKNETAAADFSLPGVALPSSSQVEVVMAQPAQNMGSSAWVAAQEILNGVVQPVGDTEVLAGSRVFGVHLLAGAYLSEVSTLGDVVAAPAETLVPPELAAAAQIQNDSPAAVAVATVTMQDMSFQEKAIVILNLLVSSGATEGASQTHASSAVAAASAEVSTAVWPESSLRLTKQRDGTTAVWLRDYRMSSEAMPPLIDALVKGAREQGARLGRIVLNGREVWTSPKTY